MAGLFMAGDSSADKDPLSDETFYLIHLINQSPLSIRHHSHHNNNGKPKEVRSSLETHGNVNTPFRSQHTQLSPFSRRLLLYRLQPCVTLLRNFYNLFVPDIIMLFSTKRKWDKLMNAAPKPAPTVTTTTTATAVAANTTSEPISPTPSSTLTVRTSSRIPVDPKKRRVDEAEITSPTKFSIRAVSPSGSVRSTRSTVLTTTTDSKAHGTYAPWDRDAFLDRLKSYRFVDKWSAKPTVVNEVAWARRGWVCFDKNRVRCNTCRAELLVAVELDDEQTEDGRALVDRYGAMVVEEHDESCLWRRKGCDGRFDSGIRLWESAVLIGRRYYL